MRADDRVRRTELAISTILRAGVVASLALVVTGLVLTFVSHPAVFVSAHGFDPVRTGTAMFPHTLGGIVGGALRLEGQAVVALGLLVLVATPVLRVAVSILAFAFQRDYLYVKITTVVLVTLITSFILGRGGG